MNEHKPEESLKVYQDYCRLNPDNPVVRHNMAVAHYYLGQAEEARVCLQRALSIKPDYKMARDKLQMLEKGKGNFV